MTKKIDVLLILLEVFTLEQLELIANRCKQVADGGYGHVYIEFRDGSPRFVTPGQRERLPKKDVNFNNSPLKQ